MRFEETRLDNILIAKVLESRIAADVAPRFKEDLMAYIAKGNRTMILDLSDVTFIDSSGLGALIATLKAFGDDGELVLCGVQDTVESMFKLTRMNRIFRVFGNAEEAVSAFS